MRSAVQICLAAPKSPEIARFQDFFFTFGASKNVLKNSWEHLGTRLYTTEFRQLFSGVLTTENLRHLKKRTGNIRGILKQFHQLFHGFIHGRLVGCFPLFLRRLEELFIHFPSQMAAICVHNMAVNVSYHLTLCVTRVTLDTLDVTTADLQLQACAAVAQAVKDHRAEIDCAPGLKS